MLLLLNSAKNRNQTLQRIFLDQLNKLHHDNKLISETLQITENISKLTQYR